MCNSMGSVKIRSLATMICRYRVQSKTDLPNYNLRNSAFSSNYGFMFSKSINSNSANSTMSAAAHVEKKDDNKIARPPSSVLLKSSLPSWAKWILGSFLTIVLPLWKQKWANLLILGGTVEKVVDEVEILAEVVEKVATTAEKISADVANEFPENSIIKEAALVVEHVSTEAAKDAKLTQDIIHKVDELEHDLTDLGTIVEPIINKIIEKENVKK